MGDQWSFPRNSHHSPQFPPQVMDWYCYIFGEHARVEDIIRNQEGVDEYSHHRRILNGEFGDVDSSYFATIFPQVEADFQDLSVIGSNTTQIRDFDVNYNYGGDFSGVGTQDSIDPDRMTYEELQNLDESSGSVSKGLSEDVLAKLPSHKYKSGSSSKSRRRKSTQTHNECDICKLNYQVDDIVTTLPCAHKYHQHCIYTWLKDNKNCCICKEEVVIA